MIKPSVIVGYRASGRERKAQDQAQGPFAVRRWKRRFLVLYWALTSEHTWETRDKREQPRKSKSMKRSGNLCQVVTSSLSAPRLTKRSRRSDLLSRSHSLQKLATWTTCLRRVTYPSWTSKKHQFKTRSRWSLFWPQASAHRLQHTTVAWHTSITRLRTIITLITSLKTTESAISRHSWTKSVAGSINLR